jgi:hypothetical protein
MAKHTPDKVTTPTLFINAKTDGDARASDLWHPHATGELDVHTVSAGHLELLQAPTSHEIGALIHRKVQVMITMVAPWSSPTPAPQ